MAENNNTMKIEEITTNRNDVVAGQNNSPNNPISLIVSKFQDLFKFLPVPPQKKENDAVSEKADAVVSKGDDVVKPAQVKLPRHEPGQWEINPPLKIGPQDPEALKDTDPLVLWQIYALGGFVLLRWVVARWNERRVKKKPSDDKPSPSPSPSPSPANE